MREEGKFHVRQALLYRLLLEQEEVQREGHSLFSFQLLLVSTPFHED